jgi:hypothetical protein
MSWRLALGAALSIGLIAGEAAAQNGRRGRSK